MPTLPWQTIPLIEQNLMTLATLGRGHKLARPDSAGLYRVSTSDRGRVAQDGIESLAPDLRKFLRRACLVAGCNELPPTMKLQGLVQAVASVGFVNLLATYKHDSFFNRKTDQRQAVTALSNYLGKLPEENSKWIKNQADSAFYEVRRRYTRASGFKSSNKRYQVKPGGKYTALDVPAVNSRKKMTLDARNAMVAEARSLIKEDRAVMQAEDIAHTWKIETINDTIRRYEDQIRSVNLRVINVGKVYDELEPNEKQALRAALAAQGPGIHDKYGETAQYVRILHEARSIKQGVSDRLAHDHWEAKAGNCDELAELACLWLKKQHVPFVSKVSLSQVAGQRVDGKKGDHVFAIVGLRLVGQHSFTERDKIRVVVKPYQRKYMREACVIDPWANIHCAVADYPAKFRLKMAEWSGKGKEISVGDGWIDPDPTTTGWYARTIEELDWEIKYYHGYDELVFDKEEAAALQR
jgi:hypothetical protein